MSPGSDAADHTETPNSQPTSETEDDNTPDDNGDPESIVVQPIKLNKKAKLGYDEVECEDDADYLLASNNFIYRTKTWDHIGVWNTKTKKIDEVVSDDE